jgi:hypothetical protein
MRPTWFSLTGFNPKAILHRRGDERGKDREQLASLHGRLEELWRQEQREDDEPTGMEPEEDAHEE